jgi:hypothetical protein
LNPDAAVFCGLVKKVSKNARNNSIYPLAYRIKTGVLFAILVGVIYIFAKN